MNLRELTLQGVRWTFVSRGLVFAFQFLVAVVLARVLTPGDFGLVGMVATATALASVFVDFGIGLAIVQSRDIDPEQLDSAFTLTVLFGATLTGTMLAAAPALAQFYGHPALESLANASSAGFLLSTIGTVPRAVLQRDMRLKLLSKIDLAAAVSGGLTSLVMAWAGMGVWSLVLPGIFAAAASSLIPLAVGGWRPSRLRGITGVRPLLKVSVGLLGFNLLNFWGRNLDNVLIGKWLGERELGLYARGYSLMLLPVTLIGGTLGTAMVPAMSKVRNESGRASRIFLRSIGTIGLVAFPMMIGLSAVAEPFVHVVLGPKWTGAIPIIAWLAPVGAIQAVANPTGWVYVSKGRTDLMLRWGLLSTVTVVGFIIAGAAMGSASSVAIAYAIASALLFVPGLFYPAQLLGFRLRDVLRVLAPSVGLSLFMFLIIRTGHSLISDSMAQGAVLAFEIALGAMIYLVPALFVPWDAVHDLKEVMKVRIGPRPEVR